jgi:hypothetical protein
LGARFIKLKAPIPPEILNQCRVLKKRLAVRRRAQGTLSIATMGVCNENCSPARIHGRN